MFNPNKGSESKRLTYKVTLLGDGGVGKTSLKKRYLGEGFSNDYVSTLGVDFTVKRFGKDNQSAIQIWDLAGQPGYDSIRKSYYVGTGGAILIYDITRPETLNSITNWVQELVSNRSSSKQLPMILVGNKADLLIHKYLEDDLRLQGVEFAENLSRQSMMEVPYVLTSAKTGFNVNIVFEGLIENIYRINATS